MNEDVLCHIEYAGLGHEVTDQILDDLSQWLAGKLNESP